MNGNEYAGLINKKYAANYREELNSLQGAERENYWLYKLADAAGVVIDDEDTWWEQIFGTSTQPLLIYNDAQQAYGFIGASTNIASSTYSTVSVRVKASVGATAYIYLVDTTDNRFDQQLSINTPSYSYWYDDSGNICASDPSANSFDKRTDIAFYLNEDNGLYEANENWSGYTSDMAGKFYANLSNYEKDSNGDLLVAEGGSIVQLRFLHLAPRRQRQASHTIIMRRTANITPIPTIRWKSPIFPPSRRSPPGIPT